MTDAEWRSRVRWVVAHPHRPAVLMVERAGRLALPETEVGDEESYYEVEVTLDDGSQVDVQLDRSFHVVGDEADGAGEDDGPGDD
jgi:hypothetical protein